MSPNSISGPVCGHCKNCGLDHLLRQRIEHTDGPASTECPACRSVRYVTFIPDEVPEELEAREEEIEGVLHDVDNVGKQVVENIKEEYNPLLRLETATVEQLTEVPYVGEETAEQILQHV